MLEDLTDSAGGPEHGVQVKLDAMELQLPLEVQLGDVLFVTLPRRRTTTGCDRPTHQLFIQLERLEP